jgi:hypothetical protein
VRLSRRKGLQLGAAQVVLLASCTGSGGGSGGSPTTPSPRVPSIKVVKPEDSAQPAPAAHDDAFADIIQDTGDHDFDVLANDTYSGTPSVSIVSQTGPGTATVFGSGTASRIRIPTDGLAAGTKTVTYTLSATGNAGSSQATMTVEIQEASASCVFFTAKTYKDPAPACLRPATRTAYYDPDTDYACRVVRVVGNPGAPVGIGGLKWTQTSYHFYSAHPAWNADGSRLLLSRLNFAVMLNGVTYAPVSANVPTNSHFYWHPTLPDRGYLCPGDDTLRYWFHANGATQIVKRFSGWSSIGWGKDRVHDSGGVEGVPSNDGDVVPLVGLRASTGLMEGFLYRVSTDTMYGSRPMNSYDHLNAAPFGDYAVEHNDIRVTLYDVNQTKKLASSSSPSCKHQNLAVFNGQQYIVGVGSKDSPSYVYRKGPFPSLSSATIFNVTGCVHTSARNINLSDWCFVSMTQDLGKSSQTYWDELLMVKLDGSVVRRLARMRYGTPTVGTPYNNEHHGCPSGDGKRAIFASNWFGAAGTPMGEQDQIGAYVVEGCDYRR